MHETENLKVARAALKNLSGIYSIIHIESQTVYIGSTKDLGGRIMHHLFYGSCNPHLLNAVAKYGISAFIFSVLEFCARKALFEREQFYLDKLFALPKHLRYNILPTANTFLGFNHSEETKEKISAAKKGKKRELKGSDHPSFGVTPPNAVLVNI